MAICYCRSRKAIALIPILSSTYSCVVVAQLLSHVWLCNPMDCSTPGFPVLHYLPQFAQTHVHWVDDAIQSSHPLSHPSPPALNLSQHQDLFQWVGPSHQMAKYWSFGISPSSAYSGLISIMIDWFDLLAIERTFKSILQHHSSKALILWRSAFIMVQLSHPYMTTGKTIALTIQTFVGKISSLLFNTHTLLFNMSQFVIAFLPRSIF